jgi:hypothetical protein
MRLAAVERGHSLPVRLTFLFVGFVRRRRVPDVIRMLLYRPEFFGRAMCTWTQAVLRGPSPWSVGERALFGAFTSRMNQCPF